MTDQRPTRTEMVSGLISLLDVQAQEEGTLFRGMRKPGGIGRVYGGQVIGQAMMAASGTVDPTRSIHSLHAYFLRGGSEDYEIDYRVESDFDGRSFSNRRVIAMQNGQVIFNLAASFHTAEIGHHHQLPAPEVPPPEECENIRDYINRNPEMLPAHLAAVYNRPSPIEMRCVTEPPFVRLAGMKPHIALWFRTVGPLDQPQSMHRSIIAYASDVALIAAAAKPHGEFAMQAASLDHSVWFHQDCVADDWLLYDIDGVWSGQARGLGMGRIYNRQGQLVASVAQEGMMRDPKLQSTSKG